MWLAIYNTALLTVLMALTMSCNGQNKEQNPSTNAPVTVAPKKDSISMEAPINNLGKAYIMGKFEPATDDRFEIIPQVYADRPGLYLRKEALSAYIDMYNAANKDGISLIIKSATRNFDYQKGIWEKKWTGATPIENGLRLNETKLSDIEKAALILKYSSMPGTSRHHWGTDIDLNSFDNNYFEKGEGLKVKKWLDLNAGTFGYVVVYTPKGSERPCGYNEERWHWSYKPLSAKIISEAKQTLQLSDITGFKGANTASALNIIEEFILCVNPEVY